MTAQEKCLASAKHFPRPRPFWEEIIWGSASCMRKTKQNSVGYIHYLIHMYLYARWPTPNPFMLLPFGSGCRSESAVKRIERWISNVVGSSTEYRALPGHLPPGKNLL